MPEPLDPQKYHILSEKTKKQLTVATILFIVFVLPVLGFYYYKLAVHRPSQLDHDINFEIKNGDGVSAIAKNLQQEGVINSEFLFLLYVFLNKYDRNIQAGVFNLRAGIPLDELVARFQHGVNDTKITFIEGWRVEELARVASKQFDKIDYNEFVRKASPYEGYLFPDTYYFEKDIREDEMVERLYKTFDEKTAGLLNEGSLKRSGLTKEQAVILASIVEREVNNDDDRPVVAGILLKRLREGIPLGADATTQYAVANRHLCGDTANTSICARPFEDIVQFNWWAKDLTQADLDFESPFNTRKSGGLPPRPISNPGLSAIDAVVNYKDTDYLYYLTDPKGITHYAKTLDEHNANVQQFLR